MRLAIEQRIFAALRVALVKHAHHPIVLASVDDDDVSESMPGQIHVVPRRAGVDRLPMDTIPVRTRGDRTTLVVEIN